MPGFDARTRQRTTDAAASMSEARGSPNPHPLLALQRTLGNRAVQQLVQTWRSDTQIVPDTRPPVDDRRLLRKIEPGKLNVVGEEHDESNQPLQGSVLGRRDREKSMLRELYGFDASTQYWEEPEFEFQTAQGTKYGDDPMLRMAHHAAMVYYWLMQMREDVERLVPDHPELIEQRHEQTLKDTKTELDDELNEFHKFYQVTKSAGVAPSDPTKSASAGRVDSLQAALRVLDQKISASAPFDKTNFAELLENVWVDIATKWQPRVGSFLKDVGHPVTGLSKDEVQLLGMGGAIDVDRSQAMFNAAEEAARSGKKGVWKVGEAHVRDMDRLNLRFQAATLTHRSEFNTEFAAWTTGVPVGFGVRYFTRPGENIFVTGSLPELGDWNPARAVPLQHSGHEDWQGTVAIRHSAGARSFEYKYIVKNGANIRWEEGRNHQGALTLGVSGQRYNDAWHT